MLTVTESQRWPNMYLVMLKHSVYILKLFLKRCHSCLHAEWIITFYTQPAVTLGDPVYGLHSTGTGSNTRWFCLRLTSFNFCFLLAGAVGWPAHRPRPRKLPLPRRVLVVIGDMAPLLLGMESWVLLSSDRLPVLLPKLWATVEVLTPLGVLVMVPDPFFSTGVFSELTVTPFAFSAQEDSNI